MLHEEAIILLVDLEGGDDSARNRRKQKGYIINTIVDKGGARFGGARSTECSNGRADESLGEIVSTHTATCDHGAETLTVAGVETGGACGALQTHGSPESVGDAPSEGGSQPQ